LKRFFKDYLDYIEGLNFAPKTLNSRRYVLGKFVERFSLENVDLDSLEAYFRERLSKVSPGSVNTERAIIRSFLMYCDRYRGYRLPFDYSMIRNIRVDVPKVRFVTEDEVRVTIELLEDEQDKLMIATLFATGVRVGELVKLRVEDFYGTELTVRGKGGKKRLVFVPIDLAKLISLHLRDNNISTGTIFRHRVPKKSRPDESFSVSGFTNRLRRRLKERYINLHAFRHGLGTSLLRGGADIRSVQEILGHAHIQTTMRYTHVTNNSLREAYTRAFKTNMSIMLDNPA
jgi:integrase